MSFEFDFLYLNYKDHTKASFTKQSSNVGHGGGGQAVNVLAFYSNNQSSNPAEDHKISIKLL